MTLRSLEIFVAVAESGKMSHAANLLHIAQPTISQAVAELEEEYGIKLFERLSRKLFITAAGRLLLSYAKIILATSEEMEKQIKDLSASRTILLGATITVGKCVLVEIVKKFEAAHPNVNIIVTIENTPTIEDLLLNSQLDLGLIEGSIHSTELISTPAIPDELVLVCHKDHPFAARASVRLHELSAHPFIMREAGSGTRELFEEKLRQRNVTVKSKWSCHGSDAILEALLANQGLAAISRRLVEPYTKGGPLCIVPIQDIDMSRSFSIVHHKTKFMTESLRDLIQFIFSENGDARTSQLSKPPLPVYLNNGMPGLE